MSSIAMTLSSTTLTLKDGKGAVTASVTNTTDRAERLVLRVYGGQRVPQPAGVTPRTVPTPAETPTPSAATTETAGAPPATDPARWATIEESVRTVGPQATEQYTVSFDAGTDPSTTDPGGTDSGATDSGGTDPGGTYTVKLNAYSAVEPPEANSGPVLELELVVPAQPVTPKPKRRWWIIAAAAALVAVVAVVAVILWPSATEVPDLKGLPLTEAQAAVADAGLVGQFNPVESPEPPDTVLDQDPAAGTEVEPESLVTVDFAVEQTVEVPDVRFAPAGAARSGLADSGLGAVIHADSTCTFNSGAGCTVIDQLPEPGKRVPAGTDVMVQLSQAIIDPFPWPGNVCRFVHCDFVLPDGTQRVELPGRG